MKGRETRGAPAAADLLVCFPSRAHLTLMPKPICSPARPSDPNNRHNHHHHHHNHHHHHHHQSHHPKKSTTRGAGQASPMLWAKSKSMEPDISEPTSPKVTCAGQIKVRPKSSACKSWQSVMEEIERIHNRRKDKKKPTWVESIGFKKEVMQFLTCLRNIRFDFRCFGAFPQTDITTDDEDDDEEVEDEEEYQEKHVVAVEESEGSESSRTVFSKWYMVLQENHQNNKFYTEEIMKKEKQRSCVVVDDDDDPSASAAPVVPPPNALLLMRCRSAPAKGWLEEKQEEEAAQNNEDHVEEKEEKKKTRNNLQSLMEEETRNNKENLVVKMAYDTDYYKISTDIAKETWVVGGIKDPLSRSRSWKR
ncbi:hypothetical protein Dsin_002740 [Dipteronia sinensis]|uniref:Uncharacterized protein n=1 Tax=Dipteronia sinensis TaxID=43782 RepID=A0AAE0EJZ1_9ROSI|nr:hypothetical protein Dsin_002740 [Dipteronia sinensis]